MTQNSEHYQNATLQRLKVTQKRYFERLLSGQYDYEYALDRLAVGIAHQRIGLQPQWYTGAFGSFVQHFSLGLQHEFRYAPEVSSQVLTALNKLVLLDVTLALDAYSHAAHNAIMRARDDAQNRFDEQAKHIEQLAFYDTLTGLPNRNLLGELVEQQLTVTRREQRTLALIYMDIINLKEVNETLGHEVGDALLKAVSLRLKQTIREMDLLGRQEQAAGGALARITGDEFALAIDDFGTGHSSLNYLKDIDADLLKIDMSFVRNLDCDAANRAIIQTIIATAHIFGMKTLAEGIENEAIADELKRMGCDFGQGYCFARPLTAKEFEQRWLSGQAADVMA